MTAVPCRGCGMMIEFVKSGKTPAKSIPLQRIRKIYRLAVHPDIALGMVATEIPLRDEWKEMEIFVSHFETCPQAARFSKREGGNG